MSRIRLGGFKVFENRAYFSSLCRTDAVLENLCSGMAANQLNMGLVTYVTDIGSGETMTAANASNAASLDPFAHVIAGPYHCQAEILTGVCRISIFPHDRRPDVAAALISALAEVGIKPHCFATSPSAISFVVSPPNIDSAMESVFEAFAFPACETYEEWLRVRRAHEGSPEEVRCRYHEDVIHIYDFNLLDGLDLWNVIVPNGGIGHFAKALLELGDLRFKMPLLVSNSSRGEGRMFFAFCLATDHRQMVTQTLNRIMPDRESPCLGPVSAIFLHGPHFGDRYGIANSIVTCMRSAEIATLALSCAVSSISLVVRSSDEPKAIKALSSTFQTRQRSFE